MTTPPRVPGTSLLAVCSLSLLPLLALLPCPCGATNPAPLPARELTLVSAPKPSPDGSKAVFEWCGDLWLAPSVGGEAQPLVSDPAMDCQPWFHPDGTRVVFQSNRSGKPQVYSVSIHGGEVRRHSFHGEGCKLVGLSAKGNQAIISGRREHPGPRGERLMKLDLNADHRERRLFDASGESPHPSADDNRWLFVRHGEQLYRIGYQGARAAQIWEFDQRNHSFRQHIAEETESLSPLWAGDGGFFYVSSRNGSRNLWKREPNGSDRQLTHYAGAGVVMPALSADASMLMFRANNEVFRLATRGDAQPEAVRWFTRAPLKSPSPQPQRYEQVRDADFHPTVGWLAALGGRIWWKTTPTANPQALWPAEAIDHGIQIAPDGRHAAWLRDDGLQTEIHVAPIEQGQPRENRCVATMPGSVSKLAWLPDASALGWIAGRGDLWLAELDNTPPRRVFSSWHRPSWDASPDGHWLVVAAIDARSNRDLWLISRSGHTPPLNLTRSPEQESSPRWSPDGKALLFRSRPNPPASAQLRWLEVQPNHLASWQTKHPLHAAADRANTVAIPGQSPSQIRWAADGRSIHFQSRDGKKRSHWLCELPSQPPRPARSGTAILIRLLPNGHAAWLRNGTPECTEPSGQTVPWKCSVPPSHSDTTILRWRFRQVWRTLAERFYQAEPPDGDWNALRVESEPLACLAADSRQFDRIINQLMGRLNASHLTFQREPWPDEKVKLPKEPSTAHPGWIFADDDASGALMILRAIPGSPGASFPGCPAAGPVGWIVRSIAGQPVHHHTPLHQIFRDAENRPLPVVLESPDGKHYTIELRCISYKQARKLQKAADTASAATSATAIDPGILSLQLTSMQRREVDTLALQLHRAAPTTTGVLLDLRGNQGGREADRLLAWFHQPNHAVTQPRGGPVGYPADRLPYPVWHGPLVVLCDEQTFSNAEIFCHAVQTSRRARLVGRPTAGGVISATTTYLPEIGHMQVPYRGWFRSNDRRNLDLLGATPDLDVPLGPADEHADRDPQHEAALRLLQQEISAAKPNRHEATSRD